jgi:ATP-dependent exoDNAse (exonuclease V) beta subunit
MDYLANNNANERDQYIQFDEGPHIYTIHNETGYTSVTTFVHSHFSDFDPDDIIDKMAKKGRLTTIGDKYYGMTREQIKEQWSKKGKDAANNGTKMHYDIECYYNYMEVENDTKEFEYFLKFDADFPELKPYRTEWMIYYEELRIAGSVDMVFENPDGTLQIYDWKRCEEIPYESFNGKTAKTECIMHLPDSKFWHYALQLNIYKAILEKKYGKMVTDLYLVRLHPDNTCKSYDRICVPIINKEIEDLFEYRRKQSIAANHVI